MGKTDKNFGNPNLEAYDHDLRSPKYEHRGNVIDFRKATAKTLERLAADPTFKRLRLKEKSEKAPPPPKSTKGGAKESADTKTNNKEGAEGPIEEAQ